MNRETLTKTIRRTYFKKFIINLIFLVFCIFLWISFPFYNILTPVSVNSIADICDRTNAKKDFIKISLPALYYSGYDCEKNSTNYGRYYYTFIEDKCVFVLLSDKMSSKEDKTIDNLTIQAKILQDTETVNVLADNLAKDINWTKEDMNKIIAPFILSEADYNIRNILILLAALTLFSLYTLLFTLKYIFLMVFPHFSPMYKRENTTSSDIITSKNNV